LSIVIPIAVTIVIVGVIGVILTRKRLEAQRRIQLQREVEEAARTARERDLPMIEDLIERVNQRMASLEQSEDYTRGSPQGRSMRESIIGLRSLPTRHNQVAAEVVPRVLLASP
jgi:hypothetical protein